MPLGHWHILPCAIIKHWWNCGWAQGEVKKNPPTPRLNEISPPRNTTQHTQLITERTSLFLPCLLPCVRPCQLPTHTSNGDPGSSQSLTVIPWRQSCPCSPPQLPLNQRGSDLQESFQFGPPNPPHLPTLPHCLTPGQLPCAGHLHPLPYQTVTEPCELEEKDLSLARP